ncbi:MAG: ribonuclease [Burkholderiales bacterium]|nr:ribonuclease [Burkholderiales bacterium]
MPFLRRPLHAWRWTGLLAAVALSAAVLARGDAPSLPGVRIHELPPEAGRTLQLIRRGGPYPHDRDGITFNNYEKRLPAARRGHYSEYTVMTPGIRHRGARRIVVGCERVRPQPRPGRKLWLEHCRDGGEFYYTADHYRSFRRIVE